MPKQSAPVQFRDKGVEAQLEARAGERSSPGLIAQRDLQRYYWLLEASLPSLSEAEWKLINDACDGVIYDTTSARLLWAGIDDAIRLDGLADKWQVDGPVLVNKLRNLSAAQVLAVIDQAERFWAGSIKGAEP